MKKQLWGLLALVLAAVVSACGSSSAGSSTTAGHAATPTLVPRLALNVCTLVTTQEMSKIVGAAMTAQPQTLPNGDPACSYKPASDAFQPSVVVGVHKDGENYYSSAQSLYLGKPMYKEVKGVGDQAFDGGDGTFYALKGEICLDVVMIQNPALRAAQLQQIAALAVSRLP